MAEVDVRIVAIAVLMFVTYGTFLYLNANADQEEVESGSVNATQFDTPDSGGFFSTLAEIGQMNTEYPEIFFINTMLFGTVAFLLVFVGLRFLRGTG